MQVVLLEQGSCAEYDGEEEMTMTQEFTIGQAVIAKTCNGWIKCNIHKFWGEGMFSARGEMGRRFTGKIDDLRPFPAMPLCLKYQRMPCDEKDNNVQLYAILDGETLVCTQHQLDARLRHTWNEELNCELPPPAPPERIVIVPTSADIKAACDKIEAEGGKPKIFGWCHDKQGRELDHKLKVVPNGRVWK